MDAVAVARRATPGPEPGGYLTQAFACVRHCPAVRSRAAMSCTVTV